MYKDSLLHYCISLAEKPGKSISDKIVIYVFHSYFITQTDVMWSMCTYAWKGKETYCLKIFSKGNFQKIYEEVNVISLVIVQKLLDVL